MTTVSDNELLPMAPHPKIQFLLGAQDANELATRKELLRTDPRAFDEPVISVDENADLQEGLATYLNADTATIAAAMEQFTGQKVDPSRMEEAKRTYFSHFQYLLSAVDQSYVWEKDTPRTPEEQQLYQEFQTKYERVFGHPPITKEERITQILQHLPSQLPICTDATQCKQGPSLTALAKTTASVKAYGGAEEKVTHQGREYTVRYSSKGRFILVDGKRKYLLRVRNKK